MYLSLVPMGLDIKISPYLLVLGYSKSKNIDGHLRDDYDLHKFIADKTISWNTYMGVLVVPG